MHLKSQTLTYTSPPNPTPEHIPYIRRTPSPPPDISGNTHDHTAIEEASNFLNPQKLTSPPWSTGALPGVDGAEEDVGGMPAAGYQGPRHAPEDRRRPQQDAGLKALLPGGPWSRYIQIRGAVGTP